MNNYTSEQLLKHGDLILEWERSGGTLKIEGRNYADKVAWMDTINPCFFIEVEYRKAPQPLYTNSIGEEFYEDNVCYYADKLTGKLSECDYAECVSEEFEDTELTEIFKTKSGALTAAAKYYADKGE